MPVTRDRISPAIGRWAERVLEASLPGLEADVRRDAPIGKVTPVAPGQTPRVPGRLRAAIKARMVGDFGSGARAKIVAPVIQAATTDKGARPHQITPKREGYPLRFYWPKVGKVVTFWSVNHPGNPPQRWWMRSIRAHFVPAMRRVARSIPL